MQGLRRLAVLATAAGMLAAAAPAAALAPPPTVRDFEDQVDQSTANAYDGTDIDFQSGAAAPCGFVVDGGGNFGQAFLGELCSPLRITFSSPQATVSLYGVPGPPPTEGTVDPTLTARGLDGQGREVATATVTPPEETWVPIVLDTTTAAPTIVTVTISSRRSSFGIDDVAYSPAHQPDTEITSGPDGTVATGVGSFAFAGNQPSTGFRCTLDGVETRGCQSPFTFSGLANGPHTFSVRMGDRWGTLDATPASRTWNVAIPLPADRDGDGDGILDASDNCPAAANAGQEDRDKDGIGDACEVLPSGTIAPVAGRSAKAALVSGDVFVKLPAGASASALSTSLRSPFQAAAGFVPLEGVASLPVGSIVDARRGELQLQAALNGRGLRRTSHYRAGIFRIKQRRALAKRKSRTRALEAQLVSPAGAEDRCHGTNAVAKGVVRSVVTVAKGAFRTVGGAAATVPAKGRSATFTTTDRCDGTLVKVSKGAVTVTASRRGAKPRRVKAHKTYLAKARLFRVRKGRSG